MKYKLTKGLENNPSALDIRKRVFVDEQGFNDEFDDIDAIAYHVVLFVKNRYAATGRLYGGENGAMHIGRVAVLREFRGMSLGSLVIAVLEKKALDSGFNNVELSAQVRVMEFYKKLGYTAVGEEYMDEDCPHIKMVKKLI